MAAAMSTTAAKPMPAHKATRLGPLGGGGEGAGGGMY